MAKTAKPRARGGRGARPLVLRSRTPEIQRSSARDGLADLQDRVCEQVPRLVQALVAFVNRCDREGMRAAGRTPVLTLGVLNRRRRAARGWIESILAGSVESRRTLVEEWLPELAPARSNRAQTAELGTSCVDLLRGLVTGVIMDEPADNLVPQAKALHAAETVLCAHRDAVAAGARSSTQPTI